MAKMDAKQQNPEAVAEEMAEEKDEPQDPVVVNYCFSCHRYIDTLTDNGLCPDCLSGNVGHRETNGNGKEK